MMIRTLLLTFFGLLAITGLQAITINSVASGNYSDATTWDCACIPSSVDDLNVFHDIDVPVFSTGRNVVIMPGAKISSVHVLNLFGGLTIHTGAEMDNDGPLNIRGPYVLNGIHSGSEIIRMRGSTIEGTGIMSNTKDFELRDGDKTILAGSVFDFSTVKVKLYTTVRLINQANVKIRRLTGTGSNIIVNETAAILEFTTTIPSIKLRTEGPGNQVIYSAPPTVNQLIRESITGYEILIARGSLTGLNRRLGTNIIVNDELRIETVQLDASNGSVSYDITMNGDWVNTSGVFVPRTGLVNFSGTGNAVKHWDDKETFGRVEFSGDTKLNCAILVTDELTLSGALDQDGKLVQVEGNWVGDEGTLSDEFGVVAFSGATDSFVSGVTDFNNVSISKDPGFNVEMTSGFMLVWKTLLLTSGTLVTNDMVQIPSGPTGTGRVGRVTNGTVVGDMYIYRYTNFAGNGWHNICAPIQDMDLTQWQSDFITTGFAGSDYPGYYFVNITRYDETQDGHKDIGFYDVSDINESVANGEGVRAYLPGAYSLFEVKGEINIGAFDFPISYTPTSGGMLMDGWNLLSNPYASNINWDSPTGWSRNEMEDAVYVWDYTTQQYASYVDGVGTNGGSPIIPASQAFWVQAQTNASALQINEFAKTTAAQIYRSPQQIEHLTIKMTSANERTDEVAFRFRDEADRDYNQGLDALELRSTEEDVPSLAFVSEDGLDCSIYSISEMREETVLPMTIMNGSSGQVTFSCEGFAPFSDLGLHILDVETGAKYALSAEAEVQIALEAGEYVDRFYLIRHYSEQGPAAALTSVDGPGIGIGQNKTLLITNADEAKTVDLRIYALNGQLVRSVDGLYLESQLSYDLSGLTGVLIIEVIDQKSGQVTIEKVSP